MSREQSTLISECLEDWICERRRFLRVHAKITTVPAIGLCKIDHLIEIVTEAAEPQSPRRAVSGIIARVGY
jgi:hypothetical protein